MVVMVRLVAKPLATAVRRPLRVGAVGGEGGHDRKDESEGGQPAKEGTTIEAGGARFRAVTWAESFAH